MNMPAESMTDSLESIRLAVGEIMPSTIQWQIEVIAADDLELRAAGAGIVAYAEDLRPSRRREYLAGRLAARAALQRLDCEAPTVGMIDGVPVWPAACCGSISHSGGLAVAIAGGCPPWQALGIDVELLLSERRHRVVGRVMSAEEELAAGQSADPWVWTRAWAAKEAGYKCCSALGFDFALEALVPIWHEANRGVMAVLIDDQLIQLDLVSRAVGDLIWVLASSTMARGRVATAQKA
jgi:4'-phosphopantetheinyl transferase EntD